MNSWQPLLAKPLEGQHIVQIYRDEDFLVEALKYFVRTGLADGEGVVVFATQRHWAACVRALAADNISVDIAESRGQLAVLDAQTALSAFMVDGMPDWKAFQDVIGTVINLTRRRYQRVPITIAGTRDSLLRRCTSWSSPASVWPAYVPACGVLISSRVLSGRTSR